MGPNLMMLLPERGRCSITGRHQQIGPLFFPDAVSLTIPRGLAVPARKQSGMRLLASAVGLYAWNRHEPDNANEASDPRYGVREDETHAPRATGGGNSRGIARKVKSDG